MVGAPGDGSREDGERSVETAGERRHGGGYADADGVGGAAVEAEDNVGAAPARRRRHLEIPHLAAPVSLHRQPPKIKLQGSHEFFTSSSSFFLLLRKNLFLR